MPDPDNLGPILLPGLREIVFDGIHKAKTIPELEATLRQSLATIATVKAACLSPADKIRVGLSQEKGGTS